MQNTIAAFATVTILSYIVIFGLYYFAKLISVCIIWGFPLIVGGLAAYLCSHSSDTEAMIVVVVGVTFSSFVCINFMVLADLYKLNGKVDELSGTQERV